MLRLGQERKELRIVDDQRGAPTSALALAAATRRILEETPAEHFEPLAGIYHVSCAGETTWCGFARAIFQKSRTGQPWASIIGIPPSGYEASAARPPNSVLSNAKLLQTFGLQLPHWESELEASLRRLNLLKISIL